MKKSLRTASAAICLVALAGCTSQTVVIRDEASPSGGTTCTYTKSGVASKQVSLPPTTGVANTGTTPAVLSLNGAAIGLTLLQAQAPCTVNSFISLASQGFFDGTSCHRLGVAEGFQLLQCGDPTGTGKGGPGYEFADELTGTEKYTAGTLAMANAGAGTATNGSQFFLVFGDTPLDPDYTVFGTIDTAGIKVLQGLAAKGTDNSEAQGVGKPKGAAVITSVTVG